MKTRKTAVRTALLLVVGLLVGGRPALGQTAPEAEKSAVEKAAPEKPTAAPKAAPKREPGQLTNVRIEVTITDQRGSERPVAKTVSLVVADDGSGMVRAATEAPAGSHPNPGLIQLPLNIDANPRILGNKVRLRISLEYSLTERSGGEGARFPRLDLKERLDLVLDDGKPVRVSESADPVSDRRVTLEVKATILR
jgi:hypothetical protein